MQVKFKNLLINQELSILFVQNCVILVWTEGG